MTHIHDEPLFADEDESGSTVAGPAPDDTPGWPILVVDDDADVHRATTLVLRGLIIEGKPLTLLHAHSASEAEAILQQHPDIAVILLDVVMESDHAGLQLVQRIRSDLNNPLVRIILRTGQPGYAPELDTIRDYDINDYKTKTELTRIRLFTSLTTALRTYRQMREQEDMRIGLETVVRASTELTKLQGMQRFADGVVRQLSVLLGVSPEGLICAEDGDQNVHAPARVIAAAGHFSHLINQPLESLPPVVSQLLARCLHEKRSLEDGGLALYFPTDNQRGLAAYLELQRPLLDTDQHLLQVFCSSMSVGFDNVILYSRMREQAYTDPLLNIPNLNQLLEWLRDPLLVCDSNTLAIVDLDDFSSINDTLGHEFGDDLLHVVYARLQQLGDSRIARIGSDIFALLGPRDVLTPANLQALFADAFDAGREPVRLSATSGLVQLENRTPGGSELLKDAHLVLKQTKMSQRGTAEYFSPQLGLEARERMRLLTSLREAFNQTQLFLMYQPKIDLRSGATSGFEALLRWRNASGDMIPPDRFIPLAEKSGMIVAIGLFVMRSACRCITRLHQQGHTGLSMAINVSQVQLKEADFIEQLQHIMADTGVNPAAIELEITESMAADDLTFIVGRLQQIRNLGVRIAIDDFGTGFSSLSVLRHLPATRLKIDRAFVNELNSDDSIARMVVSLGHSLNLQITAEGVETEEQQQQLLQLGCDEGQGWLYSPALPETGLEDWLTKSLPSP